MSNETTIQTHISRRNQVRFFQIGWGIIAILCIGLLIEAIPFRFNTLTHPDATYVYQLDQTESDLLADYGIPIEVYAGYVLLFETIQIGVFVAVSVWLFVQRSYDYMAFLASLNFLILGVMLPAPVQTMISQETTSPALQFIQWLRLAVPVLFIYTYPNGRFVPSWTVWIASVWFIGSGLLQVGFDFGSLSSLQQGSLVVAWLGPGLAAQVYRFRRVSNEVERQQARWFAFAIAIQIFTAVLRGILFGLFPVLFTPGEVRLLFDPLVTIPILDTILFTSLPVIVGISIVRYRLYGLDVVINRSMVYGAMLVALLLGFSISFFIIQGVMQLVGGSYTLALVIATAITFALFDPTRKLVKRRVDQRFFKISPDSSRTTLPTVAGVSDSLPPLARIGTYELVQQIGQGGMGSVYLARHTLLNRTVAIKIMGEYWAGDDVSRTRFEREAQVIASLQHPHIVNLFDFGVFQERYYMVMEYIVGEDLQKRIKRGHMTVEEALPVLSAIASALDYAHERGLVHRDVKAANIMLREGKNEAVLTDFGIVKHQESASALTKTGVVGTLDYVAPEQIMDSSKVEKYADIYALGIMAYFVLTGFVPFRGSVGEILIAHLNIMPESPTTLNPDIPEYVATAILRALAKSPTDRYESASAFIDAMYPA